MTILQYSRTRREARGRDGGRKLPSVRWSRPHAGSSSGNATAVVAGTTATHSEKRNSSTLSPNATTASEALPKVPVLKGPSKVMRWKRQRNIDGEGTTDQNDDTPNLLALPRREGHGTATNLAIEPSAFPTAEISHSTRILTNTTLETATAMNRPLSMLEDSSRLPPTVTTTTTAVEGKRKLLRARLTRERQVGDPTFPKSPTKRAETTKSNSITSNLERRGRHKLVLAIPQGKEIAQETAVNTNDNTNKHRVALTVSNRGGRRSRQRQGPVQAQPVAKRIKLGATQSTNFNAQDDIQDYHDGAPNNNSIDALTNRVGYSYEKLTDFAYRKTERQTARTTSRRGRGKNRGLVRVAPNEQNQSNVICPTYLHGELCTDETCRKRHDVPTEFAVPTCLYFQRHGMCLKEDCCFRHVKVNPRALVCPNFTNLGYCEDLHCPLTHTRVGSK